ncbi:MAG: hypothetical protein F6J97_14495 [Leptolyngbya sp. SIO4C1]|nr:hypothetical protein [Leptolyngbya sp. SIO4C1]
MSQPNNQSTSPVEGDKSPAAKVEEKVLDTKEKIDEKIGKEDEPKLTEQDSK